jgi:hypothetical protein
MRGAGARLVDICTALNAAAVPTPGGGAKWWPSHVSRLLDTRTAKLRLQQLDPLASSSSSDIPKQPAPPPAGADVSGAVPLHAYLLNS